MALDRGDDGFECRQFFVRPFWRRVACWTSTFPATVVIARTRTWGERSAMISATASSEAVSVSIRKRGFTRRRIANSVPGRQSMFGVPTLPLLRQLLAFEDLFRSHVRFGKRQVSVRFKISQPEPHVGLNVVLGNSTTI